MTHFRLRTRDTEGNTRHFPIGILEAKLIIYEQFQPWFVLQEVLFQRAKTVFDLPCLPDKLGLDSEGRLAYYKYTGDEQQALWEGDSEEAEFFLTIGDIKESTEMVVIVDP